MYVYICVCPRIYMCPHMNTYIRTYSVDSNVASRRRGAELSN